MNYQVIYVTVVVMEAQQFVYPNEMSERFEMLLTTQEKVFIVEHYFRLYGTGWSNGPSLLVVVNQF